MPDIKWNDSFWGIHYDWKDQGEEWSSAWGNSEAQWFGTLYPRVHRYLPAPTILEIAPGFGRWTRFLLPQCKQYYGVDLSPACIDHCKRRFAPAHHARFFNNDGKSLAFLGNTELDFVFSFDSLVHADEDVLDTYVKQILSRLSSRGAAFLHHSNAAALNLQEPIPHVRSAKVSASIVRASVLAHGGRVLSQECINWGSPLLLDCLTVFTRQDSALAGEETRMDNADFMLEATLIKRWQPLYVAQLPDGGGAKGTVLPRRPARKGLWQRLKRWLPGLGC